MNGDPGDSYRIKILARAPTTASRMSKPTPNGNASDSPESAMRNSGATWKPASIFARQTCQEDRHARAMSFSSLAREEIRKTSRQKTSVVICRRWVAFEFIPAP